ncbi:MAG: hypothetical protein EBU08_16660 [Micrococcales bacterium]|nr:hypothetical protein [Micrococcales bacterium]
MESYYERNKDKIKKVSVSYYWKHREERREWFKKYYVEVLKPRRQEREAKRIEKSKQKPVKQIIVVEKEEEEKVEPIPQSVIRISYDPVMVYFD